MRYPSVRALMQIKDVTAEDAKQIRAIMAGPGKVGGQTRMQRIDAILRTCGVEYQPAGSNQRSPGFAYCNAGDSYATTIIRIGERFIVGCWGDLVERGNYA